MEQNRDQHIYGQPAFYRGTKAVLWRKGNLFIKLHGTMEYLHAKQNKTNFNPYSHQIKKLIQNGSSIQT